jgi:hypothetical protein
MAVNPTGWSTTAGSNTTVGGVSIAENTAAANINNGMRAMMAGVKEFIDATGGAKITTGSADAQILSTGYSLSAYAAGQLFAFKAGYTNTTTTTLAVDGLAAKTVKRVDSSNLSAGDITAAGVYLVAYTSADVLILLNPTPVTGADVTALEALSTTGLAARTGSGTWATRTITGTSNEITVADGDGVSAAPTLSLPSTLALRSKAVQVQDTNFTISDNSDATKLIAFEASSITTGTTRTITVPDKSGTLAMTSDVTGSFAEVLDNQPTSDVSTIVATGCSSYKFIHIRAFFQMNSAADVTLRARVSGGTWRSVATVAGISGLVTPPSRVGIAVDIANVSTAEPKVITSSASYTDGTIDASDAANTATSAPTGGLIFGLATWSEIWDEVEIGVSSGTIEGSTADQRGRMIVYGSA